MRRLKRKVETGKGSWEEVEGDRGPRDKHLVARGSPVALGKSVT